MAPVPQEGVSRGWDESLSLFAALIKHTPLGTLSNEVKELINTGELLLLQFSELGGFSGGGLGNGQGLWFLTIFCPTRRWSHEMQAGSLLCPPRGQPL